MPEWLRGKRKETRREWRRGPQSNHGKWATRTAVHRACAASGPKIAAEFGVLHRGDGGLKENLDFRVFFFVVHFGLTSASSGLSFLRSMRTARNTRILTRAAEIPSASAMLLYGSSSISAKVATKRYLPATERKLD